MGVWVQAVFQNQTKARERRTAKTVIQYGTVRYSTLDAAALGEVMGTCSPAAAILGGEINACPLAAAALSTCSPAAATLRAAHSVRLLLSHTFCYSTTIRSPAGIGTNILGHEPLAMISY